MVQIQTYQALSPPRSLYSSLYVTFGHIESIHHVVLSLSAGFQVSPVEVSIILPHFSPWFLSLLYLPWSVLMSFLSAQENSWDTGRLLLLPKTYTSIIPSKESDTVMVKSATLGCPSHTHQDVTGASGFLSHFSQAWENEEVRTCSLLLPSLMLCGCCLVLSGCFSKGLCMLWGVT